MFLKPGQSPPQTPQTQAALTSAAARLRSGATQVFLFSAAVAEADLEYIYHLRYYGSKTRPPSSFLTVPGAVDRSKLPSGVVGYWPLDGDGTDASGNGLDGSDPAGRYIAGKYGFALAFGNQDSGSGFVIPESSGKLAAIGAVVTMAAWVRWARASTIWLCLAV